MTLEPIRYFAHARRNFAAARRTLCLAAAAAALLAGLSGLTMGAKPPPGAMAQPGYLAGQLLVAAPGMRDPRFVRTVVFMVSHDAGGAMGLVVNRSLGSASLAGLLKSLGKEKQEIPGDIRIHYGGPVQPRSGFVLHTTDYVRNGTLVVNDGVALTRNLDILPAIAAGKGPRASLFAFGYAGWAPGQLENEIKAKAWVTAPADEQIIFDDKLETKWKRAMARRGIDL